MKIVRFYIILSFLIITIFSVVGQTINDQLLPPGPYQQTCKECYVVNKQLPSEAGAGAELHCVCHAYRDEWKVQTFPNAWGCIKNGGVLINCEGKLKCSFDGECFDACKRCRMYGDVAACKRCESLHGQSGKVNETRLSPHAAGCGYDVVNNAGQLECEVPPIP